MNLMISESASCNEYAAAEILWYVIGECALGQVLVARSAARNLQGALGDLRSDRADQAHTHERCRAQDQERRQTPTLRCSATRTQNPHSCPLIRD